MKVANAPNAEPISGLDLRLLRVSTGTRAFSVAKAAGVSHQYIARLERVERPTERAVAKYLAALAEADR